MQTRRLSWSTRIPHALALLLALLLANRSVADDSTCCRLKFSRDDQPYDVVGRVLLEAQDGGLLFLADDNILWDVQPNELQDRQPQSGPLQFLSGDEFKSRVLRDLPPGFQTLATPHYLICYNTTRSYAQWCAGLFERLYRGFHGYWKKQGLNLRAPDTPLVALVFSSEEGYVDYANKELGASAKQIIGYYSLHTNRIAMYDLTGVAAARQAKRVKSSSLVNEILSAPEAERTVATVIHEATHQMAFNCGMQSRFSDVPLWLSEGIAMYFEPPDLGNRGGWRLGGINRMRWQRFQNISSQRTPDSLTTLVSSDERFRDTAVAEDTYAECWALCDYLIRKHPQQFVAYTQALTQQKPLEERTAAQRLAEFKHHFGTDPTGFETEMVTHVLNLR